MGNGVHSLDSLVERAVFGELAHNHELDVFGVLRVCESKGTQHRSEDFGARRLTLCEPGVSLGLGAHGAADWRRRYVKLRCSSE